MLENTLIKFLDEAHRILDEEPNSMAANIFKKALPHQPVYPEQVEHLYFEFAYIFRADAELQGNEQIIKHFLQNFPYAKALFADQDTEKFEANRFVRNFRYNYLEPKLYLINEQTQDSLTEQGLTATSAGQFLDPETGELTTEVYATDQQGQSYVALYNQEGTLLNLSPRQNSFANTVAPMSSAEPIVTAEIQTENTTEIDSRSDEFEAHIANQAEQTQSDQLDLLYEANSNQSEADFIEEQKLQAEAESIEQNKIEYQRAEASRLEKLAYDQEQKQQAQARQQQPKTGRRIAIAAGAGATIFSGSLAGIIIGGDLIGLFS